MDSANSYSGSAAVRSEQRIGSTICPGFQVVRVAATPDGKSGDNGLVATSVLMAPSAGHRSLSSGNLYADAKSVLATTLAVKSDRRGMRSSGQWMAGIAWFWVAEISSVGYLRGVEGENWQNRLSLGVVSLPCPCCNALRNRGDQAVTAIVADGDDGVLAARFADSFNASARADKAWRNIGGNALPRFAARRRIPRQAVLLKKNRCGTSPISKTSDNEHTTASLWYSKVLSVKNSVGEPIPELAQHPEEGSKIPSSVTGQDAGDVLPYQPFGAIFCSNGTKGEHEVATWIIQSFSQACDAE
jgi:hypothetical protein